MTTTQTLLEELAEIDTILTKGDATAEQERRGRRLVRLANAAPDLRAALRDTLSRFQSCIGCGGQIEGDAEAIAKAEIALARAEDRWL